MNKIIIWFILGLSLGSMPTVPVHAQMRMMPMNRAMNEWRDWHRKDQKEELNAIFVRVHGESVVLRTRTDKGFGIVEIPFQDFIAEEEALLRQINTAIKAEEIQQRLLEEKKRRDGLLDEFVDGIRQLYRESQTFAERLQSIRSDPALTTINREAEISVYQDLVDRNLSSIDFRWHLRIDDIAALNGEKLVQATSLTNTPLVTTEEPLSFQCRVPPQNWGIVSKGELVRVSGRLSVRGHHDQLRLICTHQIDGQTVSNTFFVNINGLIPLRPDQNALLPKVVDHLEELSKGGKDSFLNDHDDMSTARDSMLLEMSPRSRFAPDAFYVSGHYYKVFRKDVPWDVAKAECEAMGGHLACYETEYEQKLVRQQIKGSKVVWLGGFQSDTGQYQWITGQPVLLRILHGKGQYRFIASTIEGDLTLRPISGATHYATRNIQGYLCEWDR